MIKKIKYIGTNKSYTYANIRFIRKKAVYINEPLAKKLLATGEFVEVGDDENRSKESI